MERFKRFQGGFCIFVQEKDMAPGPASVPAKQFLRFASAFGSLEAQFLEFRQFQFPVPVRFLGPRPSFLTLLLSASTESLSKNPEKKLPKLQPPPTSCRSLPCVGECLLQSIPGLFVEVSHGVSPGPSGSAPECPKSVPRAFGRHSVAHSPGHLGP